MNTLFYLIVPLLMLAKVLGSVEIRRDCTDPNLIRFLTAVLVITYFAFVVRIV